jgi:hypothetical protein
MQNFPQVFWACFELQAIIINIEDSWLLEPVTQLILKAVDKIEENQNTLS